MADIRIEHVFDCTEDRFWSEIFHADDYNQRLFKEALGFPVYDQVSRNETDATITRVLEVVPKLGDMPAALKKVVGEGLGYRETGTYDKAKRTYKSVVVPNKLADKTSIEGLLWTEPASDPKKCRRLFTAKVVSKVFMVGGMLEERILADMRASYDKSATFTNRYIAEKGLGG